MPRISPERRNRTNPNSRNRETRPRRENKRQDDIPSEEDKYDVESIISTVMTVTSIFVVAGVKVIGKIAEIFA